MKTLTQLPPGVTTPDNETQVAIFNIDKLPFTIGRISGMSLQLVDKEISRVHCFIEKLMGGLGIRDANSTNGTFVNGKPVSHLIPTPLADGDRIEVGSVHLIFHDDVSPDNDQPKEAGKQKKSGWKNILMNALRAKGIRV